MDIGRSGYNSSRYRNSIQENKKNINHKSGVNHKMSRAGESSAYVRASYRSNGKTSLRHNDPNSDMRNSEVAYDESKLSNQSGRKNKISLDLDKFDEHGIDGILSKLNRYNCEDRKVETVEISTQSSEKVKVILDKLSEMKYLRKLIFKKMVFGGTLNSQLLRFTVLNYLGRDGGAFDDLEFVDCDFLPIKGGEKDFDDILNVLCLRQTETGRCVRHLSIRGGLFKFEIYQNASRCNK